MSNLVRNTEDRFSHVMAYLMLDSNQPVCTATENSFLILESLDIQSREILLCTELKLEELGVEQLICTLEEHR